MNFSTKHRNGKGSVEKGEIPQKTIRSDVSLSVWCITVDTTGGVDVRDACCSRLVLQVQLRLAGDIP